MGTKLPGEVGCKMFEHAKKMRETFVKRNLEAVLLLILDKNDMCGYDIISCIRERLGVLLSPGVIYPTLHRLERGGLIEGEWSSRRRVYTLTATGKSASKQVISECTAFLKFISCGA